MAPVVHGLEKKYLGRVDFVYLHTGEARTKETQQRLGFKSTPQIILIHPDGRKFREWTGVQAEALLTAGLDDLLNARPPDRY